MAQQQQQNWAASSVRRNCDYCVKKKVKCVGNHDGKGCSICIRKRLACIYSVKRKPGPKSRKREDEDGYEDDSLIPPSILASASVSGHNALGTPTNSAASPMAAYARNVYVGGGRSSSFDAEDGGDAYIGGGGGVGAGTNGGPPLQHSPSSLHLLTPSKKARPTRDESTRGIAHQQSDEEPQNHQPAMGQWRWDRAVTDEWRGDTGGNASGAADSNSRTNMGSSQLRRGDSLPILPCPSVAPDEALNNSSSHAGGGPPVTPPSLYHPGQRQNFHSAPGIPHSAPGRVSIVPRDSFALHQPFTSAPLFTASVGHVGGRLTLPDSVAGLGSPNGSPVEFSRLDAGAFGNDDKNDDGGGGMPPIVGLFHRVEESEVGQVVAGGGDSDGSDGSTVCDSDDEGSGAPRQRKVKSEISEGSGAFVADGSADERYVYLGAAVGIGGGENAAEQGVSSSHYYVQSCQQRQQQQQQRQQQQQQQQQQQLQQLHMSRGSHDFRTSDSPISPWQHQQQHIFTAPSSPISPRHHHHHEQHTARDNHDFPKSDSPISPHHQAHGHHEHSKTKSVVDAEHSYVRRRPSEESYQENAHTYHQRPPMMPRLVASGGVRNDRRYSGVSRPDDHPDLYSGGDADLYYGGGTTGAQGGGGGGAHSYRVPGSASPPGGMPQEKSGGEYCADDSRSSLSGVGGDSSKGLQECSWCEDVSCGDADDDGPPFSQACAFGGGGSCFGDVGGSFGDDGGGAEWGIAGNSDDEFSDFLNDIVDEFGIEGSAEITAGADGSNSI